MSKKISIEFEYEFYDSLKGLSKTDQELIIASRKAAKKAYSPYSNFHVGSAVLLDNKKVITGNNQENVAFSDGTCAERTALFYARAQYPNSAIEKIAISAYSNNFKLSKPISPCGSCRQVLAEYEHIQSFPIEILLASNYDEVYKIKGATQLLPLLFYEKNLKENN